MIKKKKLLFHYGTNWNWKISGYFLSLVLILGSGPGLHTLQAGPGLGLGTIKTCLIFLIVVAPRRLSLAVSTVFVTLPPWGVSLWLTRVQDYDLETAAGPSKLGQNSVGEFEGAVPSTGLPFLM